MGFGHEKLDVYRAAIEYVGWAYRFCENLKGHRNAKDQLLRASQAIPLNIAEGNGKATGGDRRRYFEIARGSALECGAVQDVLHICGALSADDNADRKELLDRIVAMLTKLGQRGYAIHEDRAQYADGRGGSIPMPIAIPTPTPTGTPTGRGGSIPIPIPTPTPMGTPMGEGDRYR
ncbi:MAG TPA: four helix bundle protein [Kiritimatiellia bacterium]|nr:four helix bundle protein [Kiritimatiellia bacterium]